MTYIVIGFIVFFVLVIITTYIFNKMYRKYKSAYEQEHNKLIGLEQEHSKLAEAYRIKKENKEKADEKISNLHSGDSVANAINILRK